MKITLYLMTQKGYEVLRAIVENKLQTVVSSVIIGRDKNIENDYAEEIINLCKKENLVLKERTENFIVKSNYSMAVAWRWLIPESDSKLIVLHDSLLPKYRGFAPLVNMLINKEREIGVTAIFASKDYDKGNIIAQSKSEINYPIKIAEAIDIIAKNYIEISVAILRKIASREELEGKPQNETEASYSLWRDDNDYEIDWNWSSEDILTFINAVSSPYKGASSYIDGKQKLRILEAELVEDVKIENRNIGKVIFFNEIFPVIVCGSGLLKLTKVINDLSQENVLPFKNFRIRLESKKS